MYGYMKVSDLMNFINEYAEAEKEVTVECIGDSRMGSHSYSAWTETYQLTYKDKTETYRYYTGEGGNDPWVLKIGAMIKVGAFTISGEYSPITYVRAFYNLRGLTERIKEQYCALSALSEFEELKLCESSDFVFSWAHNIEKLSSLLSKDSYIKCDYFFGFKDKPGVINPEKKTWETRYAELKEAYDKKIAENNKKYADAVGILSRKYQIPFATGLSLGTKEELYLFLCSLRGLLFAKPLDEYLVNMDSLRNSEKRWGEILRLLELQTAPEWADAIEEISSMRDEEGHLSEFFWQIGLTQDFMRKTYLVEFVNNVRKCTVFKGQTKEDLESLVYSTDRTAVYALRDDLKHMQSKTILNKRNLRVLEWSYSNDGVTRALQIFAPSFSENLNRLDISAYDGNIVGLDIVRKYVRTKHFELTGMSTEAVLGPKH